MNEKKNVGNIIKLNDNFCNLNQKSRNYIKDILKIITRVIGFRYICSIIVFGSQIIGIEEDSPVSDCDLLIIFYDNTPKKNLKILEKYLLSLEIKHEYQDSNLTFLKRILFSIQYSTGMFISHFTTKKKYCEEAIFHKIFRVNKVFSSLFAPGRIILNSIISNHKELYGDSLHKIIKNNKAPNRYEILKNLAMTLIISIFSIAILPFKKLNTIKYQLEAVKWSLRASNYYIYRDSKPLSVIAKRFSKDKNLNRNKHLRNYFNDFLQLRNNPNNNILFMLKSPLKIISIHKKAFKNIKI
ncbi:MAG: hypothetical protein KGD63_11230 [Candidatus Lokiarchaeota archaeon]|nr:hypothetical protein [Candidatus Lokiarchaeota archaeon]